MFGSYHPILSVVYDLADMLILLVILLRRYLRRVHCIGWHLSWVPVLEKKDSSTFTICQAASITPVVSQEFDVLCSKTLETFQSY